MQLGKLQQQVVFFVVRVWGLTDCSAQFPAMQSFDCAATRVYACGMGRGLHAEYGVCQLLCLPCPRILICRLSGTVVGGLQKIFTNFSQMSSQLSGPVAIVASGAEIVRTDSAGLFQFCAIININLAFVNLLPLPALDGGFLLLLAVEAVRGGKKLPVALEQGVMASGLLLLVTAGIGLIVRDTLNLLPP